MFLGLLESGLFSAAAYNASDSLPSTNEARNHQYGEHRRASESNPHGFPLALFTKGYLFLPYTSINSIDELLRADNVRAYCCGVTNSVFRQQADLYDVYVYVSESLHVDEPLGRLQIDAKGVGTIAYNDSELQSQLALSKLDTHFMNSLLKIVNDARDKPAGKRAHFFVVVAAKSEGNARANNFCIEFVGNDEWCRTQLYVYFCSMFNAARNESANIAEFNASFARQWRATHNYQLWTCDAAACEALEQFEASHPSTHATSAQQLAALISARQAALATSLTSTARYLSSRSARLRTWMTRAPRFAKQ